MLFVELTVCLTTCLIKRCWWNQLLFDRAFYFTSCFFIIVVCWTLCLLGKKFVKSYVCWANCVLNQLFLELDVCWTSWWFLIRLRGWLLAKRQVRSGEIVCQWKVGIVLGFTINATRAGGCSFYAGKTHNRRFQGDFQKTLRYRRLLCFSRIQKITSQTITVESAVHLYFYVPVRPYPLINPSISVSPIGPQKTPWNHWLCVLPAYQKCAKNIDRKLRNYSSVTVFK